MSRNCKFLFGVAAAKWALLCMPIFVIYLLSKGFTLAEVFLLQSLYAGSIFLFEIPTGYLSDRGSRKKLLIIALFLRAVGKFVYWQGSSFLSFAIAEVFLALSMALISGTDVAMLYDSLAEEKREKDFQNIESKRIAISQGAAATSGLLGGALASISLSFPFFLEGVICLLMGCIMFASHEPERHGHTTAKPTPRLKEILHSSIVSQPAIRWIILLTSSLLAATSVMIFLAQPYMLLVDIPLVAFGYIWCFAYSVAAIFSALTPSIEQRFGLIGTLKLMALTPGVLFITLSFYPSVWIVCLVASFFAIRAMIYSISRTYINELVDSSMRATVLSIKGCVARLCFSLLGPIVGYVGDILSLQAALFICGAFFLITCATLCSLFIRSDSGSRPFQRTLSAP